MRYAVIVGRTNGSYELHYQDDWHLELSTIHELLNDGFFEVVNPLVFHDTAWTDVRLLVDDCGLMKDLPVNRVATMLYASPFDVIVGDVIFCTTCPQEIEDEPDVYAFTEDDAKRLVKQLY